MVVSGYTLMRMMIMMLMMMIIMLIYADQIFVDNEDEDELIS